MTSSLAPPILPPAAKKLLQKIEELTANLCDGFPKAKALYEYLMEAKKIRLHKMMNMSWPNFLKHHRVTSDRWSNTRLVYAIGSILDSEMLPLPIKYSHYEPLRKFRDKPEYLKFFWVSLMDKCGEEEIPTAKEIKHYANHWDFQAQQIVDIKTAIPAPVSTAVEHEINPREAHSTAPTADAPAKDTLTNCSIHELAVLFLDAFDHEDKKKPLAIGKQMAETVIMEELKTHKPSPEQLMFDLGPETDAKLSATIVGIDFFIQQTGGFQPQLEFSQAV